MLWSVMRHGKLNTGLIVLQTPHKMIIICINNVRYQSAISQGLLDNSF